MRDDMSIAVMGTRIRSLVWAAALVVAAIGAWLMFDAMPGINWAIWTALRIGWAPVIALSTGRTRSLRRSHARHRNIRSPSAPPSPPTRVSARADLPRRDALPRAGNALLAADPGLQSTLSRSSSSQHRSSPRFNCTSPNRSARFGRPYPSLSLRTVASDSARNRHHDPRRRLLRAAAVQRRPDFRHLGATRLHELSRPGRSFREQSSSSFCS